MSEPKKRGRKPLPPEERARRRVEQRAASKAKVKNITVDADMVDALNEVADNLSDTFGFRPTISQTLRYLIKRAAS